MVLRKLLGLCEPNPVEIPKKLIRIYVLCPKCRTVVFKWN